MEAIQKKSIKDFFKPNVSANQSNKVNYQYNVNVY